MERLQFKTVGKRWRQVESEKGQLLRSWKCFIEQTWKNRAIVRQCTTHLKGTPSDALSHCYDTMFLDIIVFQAHSKIKNLIRILTAKY